MVAPYLNGRAVSTMIRLERRANRLAAYVSSHHARELSRPLGYKTCCETGALTPPVEHSRPRWGGADGMNRNGNGYAGSHRGGKVSMRLAS